MRLGLTLLIVRLVSDSVIGRTAQHEGSPAQTWHWRRCFSIFTIVIHSFFEFALHIPAVTFLTVVLLHQLAAWGVPKLRRHRTKRRAPRPPEQTNPVKHWGLAPCLGATMAVLLGWSLGSGGPHDPQGGEAPTSALQLVGLNDSINRDRQIKFLEAAARLAPEDAHIQFMLAQVHLASFHEQLVKNHLSARRNVLVVGPNVPAVPMSVVHACLTAASLTESKLAARNELIPALRHSLHQGPFARLDQGRMGRDLAHQVEDHGQGVSATSSMQ